VGTSFFALIPIVSSPLRQYTSMRQVEDTRDGKSNRQLGLPLAAAGKGTTELYHIALRVSPRRSRARTDACPSPGRARCTSRP